MNNVKVYIATDTVVLPPSRKAAVAALEKLKAEKERQDDLDRRARIREQMIRNHELQEAQRQAAARREYEAKLAEESAAKQLRLELQRQREDRCQRIVENALVVKFNQAAWISRKLLIVYNWLGFEIESLALEDRMFDGTTQCTFFDMEPGATVEAPYHFAPYRYWRDEFSHVRTPTFDKGEDPYSWWGVQNRNLNPKALQWFNDPKIPSWYSLHDHDGTLKPCKLPATGYLHIEHVPTGGDRWLATADYLFTKKSMPYSDRFPSQPIKL